MLKNITLGQYFPIESPIHHLDPRIKIVLTFVFMVLIFLVRDITIYSIIFLYISIALILSKVPIKYTLKGLRPILFFIVITVILNVFFTAGDSVLLNLGPITITKEGLYQAAFMALRLIFLVVSTTLLTLTTSPIQLTDGIEHLLNPLKVFKFPAHELAMMMTIALRFIPTLLEETDKIMKAQMARGADFESGNIIKRAKSMVPLLIPLFVSAFRRAEDLATAMESRCYRGGEGRTRLRVLKIRNNDYIAVGITVVFTAVVVVLGVLL